MERAIQKEGKAVQKLINNYTVISQSAVENVLIKC